MESIDATKVLERFEIDGPIPRLSVEEQLAVRKSLGERSMRQVFGSLNNIGENDPTPSVSLSLSHEGNSGRYLSMPGAVIGPYFLGDFYSAQGIAIWVPEKSEASITQN